MTARRFSFGFELRNYISLTKNMRAILGALMRGGLAQRFFRDRLAKISK